PVQCSCSPRPVTCAPRYALDLESALDSRVLSDHPGWRMIAATRAGVITGRFEHVMKTAVVLGVSGQIGTAVARRLLADGWSVRGLHDRDTPLPADLAAVQVTAGDRNDDAVLARVLGNGADGVVDTIAYNPVHARQLLAYAGDVGALAVVSSVAV